MSNLCEGFEYINPIAENPCSTSTTNLDIFDYFSKST